MNQRLVEPLSTPPDVAIAVPGSKSFTNRALVTAALADGASTLDGVLGADDTEAMIGCLQALGAHVAAHGDRAEVQGTAGRLRPGPLRLDVRQSGTTARFVAPVAALGTGRYTIDGSEQMRARPMGHLVAALRALGVEVSDRDGRLPLVLDAAGVGGGRVELPGNVSSQFLSGLLMAGPLMQQGLEVALTTELVSKPYVDMTIATMAAFGVPVARSGYRSFTVAPGAYRGVHYRVEPDASAASYFFAAAAITAGRVRVEGLGRGTLQGDARFVDVLEAMGARVERDDTGTTVAGTGELHGVDVDLADLSDTAPTLAAVAVFADAPTRVRGIGFIRAKETDRIGAVVTELRRCGIDAHEEDDGFVVVPGSPRPAIVQTYDDHRMAMAFALLGLRAEGIRIADPGCVAKTFPGFWDAFDRLRG